MSARVSSYGHCSSSYDKVAGNGKEKNNAYIWGKKQKQNYVTVLLGGAISLWSCEKNQPISSLWIIRLYLDRHTCTNIQNALARDCTVFHQPIHHVRPRLLIWNQLWLRYKSMYLSSESRWDRKPLTDLWSQSVVEKPHGGRFTLASKTQGCGTMGGQLWKGRRRRLHLRLRAPSLWEALVVLRKERKGSNSEN